MVYFLRFLLAVLLVIGVIILAMTLCPWKVWIAEELEFMLGEQGFENPQVSVEKITLDTISLRDMTIGTENPLTLQNLEIRYTPQELWNGKLRSLMLDDLQISFVQTTQGWQMRGFKVASEQNSEHARAPIIPITRAMVDDLPFDDLDIKNSLIAIIGNGWDAYIPFTLGWKDDVTVISKNIRLKQNKMTMDIADISIQAQLRDNDRGWTGTWVMSDVSSQSIPSFDLQGTFTLNVAGLSILGQAKAKDESGIKASFGISYVYEKPQDVIFTLKEASMPWGGGVVSTKNVSLSVMGQKPITLPMQVNKVSVDDLMRLVTGEYVRATGTLSGALPVIIGRNGLISLGNGILKADRAGQLSMPPEGIPGTGEQIEMTRDILKNFQYDGLSLDVKEEGKGKISVLVALKGNNPEMYNGRAVHLNVRLGGDVLDFVRNNVMMIMQPGMLLNQEQK